MYLLVLHGHTSQPLKGTGIDLFWSQVPISPEWSPQPRKGTGIDLSWSQVLISLNDHHSLAKARVLIFHGHRYLLVLNDHHSLAKLPTGIDLSSSQVPISPAWLPEPRKGTYGYWSCVVTGTIPDTVPVSPAWSPQPLKESKVRVLILLSPRYKSYMVTIASHRYRYWSCMVTGILILRRHLLKFNSRICVFQGFEALDQSCSDFLKNIHSFTDMDRHLIST